MTESAVSMSGLYRTVTRWGLGLALACTAACACWAQSPAASAPQAKLQSKGWSQLSTKEQRALAPLAARWGELSEIQKSKWLAISQNFEQMPASDKAVMHARMSDWVNLSPVQRNQARLNFNTLQNLPKDEKKAKWDEYQSLSPEQKRQLSSVNQGPAKTTAPSSKPANAERFVPPPAAWQSNPAAGPISRGPIDKKTLLPLPAEVSPKAAPPQPEASSPRDDAAAS